MSPTQTVPVFSPMPDGGLVATYVRSAMQKAQRFPEVPRLTPQLIAACDATARLALLTKAQANILQLVCAGRLNKQIAFEMGIAETTVKAHVTAIMRKLGVQSRTQAVLIARQASFSSLMPEG